MTNASLADIAIWDHALTSSEAAALASGYAPTDDLTAFAVPKLRVNTTTGQVDFVNFGTSDVNTDYYQVTSAAGSLTTSTWASLEAQDRDNTGIADGSGNGWEELGNNSATKIGEAILTGEDTLAAGDAMTLGGIFTPGSDQDLVLTIRKDGAVTDIEVEYYSEAAMPGVSGLDSDNIVNAQDLAAVQANFGSKNADGDTQDANGHRDGIVNLNDLFNVRNNDNNNYNGAVAIPEPSSIALLALTLATLARRRK